MTEIQNVAKEIMKQLQYYAADVKEKVEEAKDEIAKEIMQEIRAKSPTGKRGEYAKGWRIKRTGKKLIVHNKTNYQLTHLLEHGHIKKDGSGRTQEKIHIAPAEQKGIKDYLKKIERAIKP